MRRITAIAALLALSSCTALMGRFDDSLGKLDKTLVGIGGVVASSTDLAVTAAREYKEARAAADTNKDGKTSIPEWMLWLAGLTGVGGVGAVESRRRIQVRNAQSEAEIEVRNAHSDARKTKAEDRIAMLERIAVGHSEPARAVRPTPPPYIDAPAP